MNKFKLAALLAAVAFASEAAGVVRANHRAKKIIGKLRHQNRFLTLSAEAMAETLDNIQAGVDPEEAFQRFEEQKQYITIVNNSL